jgi:hypothetical protein
VPASAPPWLWTPTSAKRKAFYVEADSIRGLLRAPRLVREPAGPRCMRSVPRVDCPGET